MMCFARGGGAEKTNLCSAQSLCPLCLCGEMSPHARIFD